MTFVLLRPAALVRTGRHASAKPEAEKLGRTIVSVLLSVD